MDFDLGPLQVGLGRRLLPGATWRGAPESGAFALTFDDGPDSGCTPRLLDALSSLDIKTHFFVLGERLAEPGGLDVVRRAVAEGHGVGLHGDRHRRWLGRRSATVIEELRRLRDRIVRAVGIEPEACSEVRPPFGLIGPGQARRLTSAGFRVVICDVLPGDWSAPGPVVVRRVLKRARAGSIVALHDAGLGGANAPETVEAIVGGLRRRGLRVAPLQALIGHLPSF